jgi:hypothetical protein
MPRKAEVTRETFFKESSLYHRHNFLEKPHAGMAL